MGNKQDHQDPAPAGERATPRMNLYLRGGAALVIAGGLLLLSQRLAGKELPPWLYYTAIGADVAKAAPWLGET